MAELPPNLRACATAIGAPDFTDAEFKRLGFEAYLVARGLRDEGLNLAPCQSCGCLIEPRPIGPLDFAWIAERGGIPLELCGSCAWLIAGGCR